MFLVFAGKDYYPQGGADDLIGMSTGRQTALLTLAQAASTKDWGHVFDTAQGKIIESFKLVGATVKFTTHE